MSIKIDITKCTGCGTCAGVCPQNAIRIRNSLAVVNEDLCVDCGRCVPVCPSRAISTLSPAPAAEVNRSERLYKYGRVTGLRGRSLPRTSVGRARGGMPRRSQAGLRRGGRAYTAPGTAVYPPSPAPVRESKLEALKEQSQYAREQLAKIEAKLKRLSNK